MLQNHYVADNTLLCELHNTNINKTIRVRGESEQRAIRHFAHFTKRKSRNGYMNYSHLPSKARRREQNENTTYVYHNPPAH